MVTSGWSPWPSESRPAGRGRDAETQETQRADLSRGSTGLGRCTACNPKPLVPHTQRLNMFWFPWQRRLEAVATNPNLEKQKARLGREALTPPSFVDNLISWEVSWLWEKLQNLYWHSKGWRENTLRAGRWACVVKPATWLLLPGFLLQFWPLPWPVHPLTFQTVSVNWSGQLLLI